MENKLELYIHIPFCVRKCLYCDFLSGIADQSRQEAYVVKLREEIAGAAPLAEESVIGSIFIGGGTPSIIAPELITDILATVRQHYRVLPEAEITIECNPASAMRYKFAIYREAGINRLSIGLQSANNEELKVLGRVHTFEEFLKSFQSARMEGFHNINVDLMNCIPTQTPGSWKKTLKTVLMMRPEHVSVYNLIVEPQTPFETMMLEGRLSLPTEEKMQQIDSITEEMMETQKYRQYEVSNYAKEGFSCRHNIGYWTGVPYLGFGLGASSYYDSCRFKNTAVMEEYLNKTFLPLDADTFIEERQEVERLTPREQMREFMILGLRMTCGVSDLEFYQRFSLHLKDTYGDIITRYLGLRLMKEEEGRLKFTKRGMDVSNQILAEF